MGSDNKQMVREYLAALCAGDMARLGAVLTDGVKVWMPQSAAQAVPGPNPVVGRAPVVELISGMGKTVYDFTRARVEMYNMIAEGDLVAAHWSLHTKTLAGVSYDNDYIVMYRFADGLIDEVWEATDTAYAYATFAATAES